MLWILLLLHTVLLENNYKDTNSSALSRIPKILHYVWVGNNEKPPKVVKCVESWYKYCKDWLIVEWNDFSLGNINNTYIDEAYRTRKWAFVGDYLRIYALAMYGGVYVDADVELLKPIDSFLNVSFFLGRENYYGYFNAGPHLMGAVPHTAILTDILSEYTTAHFLDKDGKPNYYVLPDRFKRYFKRHYDFKIVDRPNETTILTTENESMYIYPWWYFCKPLKGEEAWAIHHFHGSWLKSAEKEDRKIEVNGGERTGENKTRVKGGENDRGKGMKLWEQVAKTLITSDVIVGLWLGYKWKRRSG